MYFLYSFLFLTLHSSEAFGFQIRCEPLVSFGCLEGFGNDPSVRKGSETTQLMLASQSDFLQHLFVCKYSRPLKINFICFIAGERLIIKKCFWH